MASGPGASPGGVGRERTGAEARLALEEDLFLRRALEEEAAAGLSSEGSRGGGTDLALLTPPLALLPPSGATSTEEDTMAATFCVLVATLSGAPSSEGRTVTLSGTEAEGKCLLVMLVLMMV